MALFASQPLVLAAGGLTDLNPGLTLWTAITFLFLLLVLSRFAWGPIVKMLNERERTIREAIEAAKKERAEAERMLAEQKASLAQAQREAAELAKRNQQEVEVMRQELTARARKEADDLVASARQPTVAGDIRTSMIIAAALIEGVTLFAIVVCVLLAIKA